MAKHKVHVSTTINKSPAEVVHFVADVRNRAQYQTTLEASDVQGNPEEVGSTWQWKWSFGDKKLSGLGRCTAYEAGKRYAFETEGTVASVFEYTATPAGSGTKLDVNVEVSVPEQLVPAEAAPQLLQLAQQKGQESLERLKALLEK